MVEIRLFGKPEIKVNGRTGRLPTAKTVALLAYLALEPARAHLREHLTDLLWPEFDLPQARQNLSKTLSRIRKALGPAATLIQADHTTVAWEALAQHGTHPVWVDVVEFNQLLATVEAHAHADKHRCRDCQKALERAVELACGELLTGVEITDSLDFDQWLMVERERLHTALLHVLFDLTEAALLQKAYRSAIEYAKRQLVLEAWREQAARQLIRGLALAGRRAEALAAYEQLRETLAAELGVEPGTATLQLLGDVQANRVQAAAGLQLPEGLPAAPAVIRQLGGKHLLLILDNFEHLVAGRNWLVDLLRAAPGVMVLVTSRERLGLMAEDVYLLDGLAVPTEDVAAERARDYSATALFLDRARRINKRWRLNADNWPHVVAICRALEGLPLGIELAITLLESTDAATIAERIRALWPADRELLATGFDDVAAHQRSLYTVFAQSWERLTEQEQTALARLSVIHGEFELQAARTIGATTATVIKRLQYKSLLRNNGAGRVDMHPLIRQFAALQLTALPAEGTQARRQHAHHFLALLGAYTNAQGAEQRRLLSLVRQNVLNVQTGWLNAIELNEIGLLSEAIGGLARFYAQSSLLADARKLFQALRPLFADRPIDTLTDQEQALYGQAIVNEAGTWADIQTYARSNAILDAASGILSTVTDRRVLATIDYHRGRSALQQGDNRLALALMERGLHYARQSDDYELELKLLRHTGSVFRQRGDYLTYLDYLEQALTICRRQQDTAAEQVFLYFNGVYRAVAGEYWRGRTLILAAQALDVETRAPYYRWASEATVGVIDVLLGQVAQGIARQERALVELQAIGETWRVVSGLVDLATAQMADGQYTPAADRLATARSMAKQLRFVELAAYVDLASAYLAMQQAQYQAAEQALAAVEQQMTAFDRRIGVVEAQLLRASCAQQRCASVTFARDSLRYVCQERLDGAQQRERLYWTAFQVASAAGLAEASDLLAAGRSFVETTAAQIEDPDYRASYLTRSPVALLLR